MNCLKGYTFMSSFFTNKLDKFLFQLSGSNLSNNGYGIKWFEDSCSKEADDWEIKQ
jgi:hypothetical protein